MEYNKKSHAGKPKIGVSAYDYPAILKRIRMMGGKAGIKKPLDFYNFRHSACRLAKLSNLPHDLAAEKFGHSVEFYIDTYARLNREDMVNRHRKATGEVVKEKKIAKPILCSVCDTVNEPKKEYCDKCGNPLSLTVALKEEKARDKKLNDLEKQMQQLLKLVNIREDRIESKRKKR